MELKVLTAADAAVYWQLRLEALQNSPEAFGSSYEDAVQRPFSEVQASFPHSESQWIVGAFTEQHELAGMVGFRQEPGRKMKHKGFIWGMYVRPAFRGMGTGKQLMQAAVQRARTVPGLEQVQLAVVTANTAAKRLYEAMGFEAYGQEQHALKLGNTYLDEIHMVLFFAK